MKKLTKKDITKLKYLSEQAIESEAMMLSNDMYQICDNLGNNYENLPDWQQLIMLAGAIDNLAVHIKFLKSLDNNKAKR